MKPPARLWKRLEALESSAREEINGQGEINAIFRKYRGMKALRLAIEKAREFKGEPTRADDDAIRGAVGLTGMRKLRQEILWAQDRQRRSGEV